MNLSITRLNSEGEGVGRLPDGRAIFVPGALPGEEVAITVSEEKRNYARGTMDRILVGSPQRVTASCTHHSSCGGCSMGHLSYSGQLEYKRQKVVDALERVGGFKGCGESVLPVLPSPKEWGYRNKVQLLASAKAGAIGFCEPGTNHVTPYAGCRLVDPVADRAALAVVKALIDAGLPLREWPVVARGGRANGPGQALGGKPGVRHVVVRALGGRALVTIVTDPPSAESFDSVQDRLIALARGLMSADPGISGVAWNLNGNPTSDLPLGNMTATLAGDADLSMGLLGCTFRVSPTAFIQVNTEQTSALYSMAIDFLEPDREGDYLDLYCGAGTITLPLANKCGGAIGVEVVASAVEDARVNARVNGIGNARFIAGTVESALPRLLAEGVKPKGAVLDPPRKGCEAPVLDALIDAGIPRLVYVACDPASLARDAARLREAGYMLGKVQPVDMFPQTHHVECVALIKRL